MHWFRRIVLGAAFTTGYVLGARAGRRRYEQISTWWHGVMNTPVAKEATERGRGLLEQAQRGLRDRLHAVPEDPWPRSATAPV